jgi:hypothetical protein
MLKCDEYSAVIDKWLACNRLRANDYSAVIIKFKQNKEMRQIVIFLGRGGMCALSLRAFALLLHGSSRASHDSAQRAPTVSGANDLRNA